jgi:hypothetical protein
LESEDKKKQESQHNQKDQKKQESQQPQSNDEKKEEKKITHSEILEDLDKNVTVWSDFLKPLYHPKSMCIVKQFTHGADDFDVYRLGNFMKNQVRTEIKHSDILLGSSGGL